MPSASAASRPSTRPVPSDFWGGLAAMLVAFPSAIAYGVLVYAPLGASYASVGAIAGIMGAIALGMVAPLVGRNVGFVSTPCAPAAAVLSGLAATLAANGDVSAEQAVGLIALTALLSALLQIAYGLVRAGRLIKFIPSQVVSGFLSGVAVIIAAGQMPKLLGVPSGTELTTALVSSELWSWPAIVVGLATIIVTVAAPRLTTKVPASIIGLVAGIATYFTLGAFLPELLTLEGNGLVIGSIRSEGSVANVVVDRARSLLTIDFAAISSVATTAVTLSVLLSIDTLKTGVLLDALTRRRHNSNRELVAQGVANTASFFAGGMAGAGGTGASLMNVTSGGKTIWSSVLAGALALVTYVALGDLLAWVPVAVFAGILLVVSYRMFDFKMFRLLRHRSTLLDFLVIAAVTVVAHAVGLIEAAGVGVGLAIFLFIRTQIRSEVLRSRRDLRAVRSKRFRTDAANDALESVGDQAVFIELQDDLFFGTTDQLLTQLDDDLAHARYLLLDLRRVASMDFTAVNLVEQMRQRLFERQGALLICGIPSIQGIAQSLQAYIERLGPEESRGIRIFETRDATLEWTENQLLEAAGLDTGETGPPLPLEAIGLLEGIPPEALEALHGVIHERSLATGEKLFARGDTGDEVFLVRNGRVHILLPLEGGKRHHLATFCAGESFGDMAFLDRGERSADAEAATDSKLFVLTRDDFNVLSRTHADVAASFFEHLAKLASHRLRLTNTELRAVEDR